MCTWRMHAFMQACNRVLPCMPACKHTHVYIHTYIHFNTYRHRLVTYTVHTYNIICQYTLKKSVDKCFIDSSFPMEHSYSTWYKSYVSLIAPPYCPLSGKNTAVGLTILDTASDYVHGWHHDCNFWRIFISSLFASLSSNALAWRWIEVLLEHR